ncbi:MBL fold metallo-hydrolase [Halomarina litorea]|uniref:MBL fold metallo-hydrolase n=1 Tax=Halomarina litorea TaxID=2961595 RepID=UPI0020C200CA|nr:MBL fold metallo-hydrolase [Halomarina sp. BCD28]
MEDVHRFEIPTPFDVGRVNCYAFVGDRLTLLDPGPATGEAYDALSAGLESLGFAVTDVDQILVTHPHMDHFGLAARIVRESDAHVHAHRDAVKPLSDPLGHFRCEQVFFRPFLRRMGAPAEIVESAVSLPEAYTDYQDPLAVDYELTDGESVEAEVELTAVHTPGHSPGSICFVAAANAVAFTGDHVLPHITPNPLLTIAPDTESERTRSLPTYLDSLHKITDVNVDIGWGGHGKSMPNLSERVRATIDHHLSRKERIADIVGKTGPTTAYQVMQVMFPDLPATEVFPGMSEVIGHLDLLEDEDRVDITEREGYRQYTLR